MTFRQCKIKHIIRYSLVCAREIYLIVRCPVRKFVGEKYLLNGTTCTIFKKKKKRNETKLDHYIKKARHLFNLIITRRLGLKQLVVDFTLFNEIFQSNVFIDYFWVIVS